jgi:hypothetical protein
MTEKLIQSDSGFTDNERAMLKSIAGLMIPASAQYGVPGADDEKIFAGVLASLAPTRALVSDGLHALDAAAREKHGAAFVDVADQSKIDLVQGAGQGMFLRTAVVAILQSYYQDPRVMASLDMEIRPPFPGGFEVDEGDWSLLEPVRTRARMYRDA